MKHIKTCMALALSLCLTVTPPPLAAKAQAAAPSEKVQRYVSSMNTLISLTAYGEKAEKALDMAEEEILRLNAMLSTGLADSEISQINENGGGTLSQDTAAIMQKALELYQETDGIFDTTIYPLMVLWGFATTSDAPADDPLAQLLSESEHNYHVPTQEELEEALSKVGSDRVSLDPVSRTLTLGEGQSIDLGGIAKGYASAKIMEVYKEAGLTSGMVSLGGNVQCLGVKPDGSDYVIAIRDPFDTYGAGLYAATMKVHDEAIITSGGYERFFTDPETGVTYQHIMDPRTGYPAQTDLASVTIVTGDGMLGDGLSTTLYIYGLDDAIRYWKGHADQFEMILIDADGKLYATEGLKEQILTPTDYTLITREE